MFLDKIKILIILAILMITYLGYINYRTGTVITSQNSKNPVSVEQAFSYGSNNNIKVMTYNIRFGHGLDDKLNLDRIIEIIKNTEAQIITLNEVDQRMPRSQFQDQIEIIAEKLNMNHIYGPNIQTGIGGYGNAILTEFPVKKAQNHLLPYNNIGSEPRGLLTGTIKIPTQKNLQVMTTHLSLHHKEREKQKKWIKQYIENLNSPYLLMGDFNTELKTFAGSDSQINKNSFPSDNPIHAIDLIFADSQYLQLIESSTIETEASDHLPVIADFVLNENK